jgi:signal transduction histidine kinase
MPLHALLGVLTLMMAGSRSDQREALRRVSGDGKLLLATIDNLTDLTQIKDRDLQRQPINVATIVRDAADNARPAARERQINIAVNPERDAAKASAMGDSWAMRRILDNLLANAVRFTPPGGTVSVSVARNAGTVTASVSDAGKGLPDGLAADFHVDAPATDGRGLLEVGDMGLALSRRLAQAMNGRLTAAGQPGAGAILILSLPAA